MSLFAQPSVVSGGFSCWEASGWTMWAPCWLALQIVSAARLRSIAGGRTMGTSSPSWKGRIQGTAMGTPASTSRTSQGISLLCKSGGRSPARLPSRAASRSRPPAAGSRPSARPSSPLPAARRPPGARQARCGSGDALGLRRPGAPALAGGSRSRVGASPRGGPQPARGAGAQLPPPPPPAGARREGASRVLCPPLNSNSLATLKWNKVDEVRSPAAATAVTAVALSREGR